MVRSLRAYFRQPAGRKRLLIEAAFFLLCARLLLRLLSFRQLTRLLEYPIKHPVLSENEELQRVELRNNIRWAIERSAAHLPGPTVCFPRGMAAQAMCRRRGIDTKLYYGAAVLAGQGLAAHVWVQDGSDGVVGYQEAGQYLVLARFPV